MPVYQTRNITNDVRVGIWKVIETEAELLNSAKTLGIKVHKMPVVKNQTRVKQWIATRLLLNTFFKNVDIDYDSFGKPSLNNGWRISISHSGEFVAIILNKKGSCGIDIEKVTDKVKQIQHKFLSTRELNLVSSTKDLIIFWGAKEALYKYYGKKEVLFIKNLFIKGYSPKNDSFKGKIVMPDLEKEVDMFYNEVEDYILIYTF